MDDFRHAPGHADEVEGKHRTDGYYSHHQVADLDFRLYQQGQGSGQ